MASLLTVLLAVAITANASPFTGASTLPAIHERDSSVVDCLNSNGVPISLINSPNFSQLNKPFNLRLPYTPAAIATPYTSDQVVKAVDCAFDYKVKVQARSGGHGYASYSSGGKNGSLVINLENFQEITVDQSTGIAKVGGGVRLGNLALGLYKQGQRAVPHGTCPGVGIGGHFTHGGFGFASRLWGLALDSIVGMDVVLPGPNSRSVYVSEDSFPNMFWALRGSADSFGVVTTFHLQTQKAPDSVINWAVNIPQALNSAQQATDAFMHIQAFAQNSSVIDRQITFGVYIDNYQYRVYGLYHGADDKFYNQILPELLRGLPQTQPQTRRMAWLDALADMAYDSLAKPFTGYDEHDTFYARSVVTKESEPLTPQAVKSFFDYAISQGKYTDFGWYSIIDLYGGPDSQINVHATNSSSYSHRSNLWVFQNYARTKNMLPPAPADMIPFIQGLSGALTNAQSNGNFAAYQNYVDPELTSAEAHSLYYDPDTYQKLIGLKFAVDPGLTFWNPQAVGT